MFKCENKRIIIVIIINIGIIIIVENFLKHNNTIVKERDIFQKSSKRGQIFPRRKNSYKTIAVYPDI